MKLVAAAIVVGALIIGAASRYEISATAYRLLDGSEIARLYRVDRLTGEVCTRPTNDANWVCYLSPGR